VKKVFVIIIVLLLLAAGTAWYFVSYRMDAMIKQRIEMAGSISHGERVSVGEVSTSIKDGSLTISNVTVANPPGFRNKNALSLNDIVAAVDYSNLDIKRLVIENPEIVIEELNGETNFSRMLAAMEQGGSATEPASGDMPEQVIVIRYFRMNSSRAVFESDSLERYTDIKIHAVELNDLKGTPIEISRIIAARILKEIAEEAATEMLKAQAKKQFKKTQDKVSSKLNDLLGSGDDDSEN
jgi:hypothetical protein